MLFKIFNLENYIPTDCFRSVFEIDYTKLYESGKRILLFDLDNTLISYRQEQITTEIIGLFKQIENIGFTIVIISNNTTNRLKKALEGIEVDYIANAKKPLKCGFKKMHRRYPQFEKDEILLIGDQLMTDCLGANNFGIDVILVKTIERESEKWFTKINRYLERNIIKKLYKRYPLAYQKLIILGGFDGK